MENFKPIKIAVLSFKNGHAYWLYRAIASNPKFEVVAITLDPGNKQRTEALWGKQAFNSGKIYYNAEEMLNAHPDIEACVLASENSDHLRSFKLLAERGINIISMKVPTMDLNEYDEMIRLQKEHNIIVYIELEMRWHASIERIKSIVKSGVLGKIESFNAYNYSHNPYWASAWTGIAEQSYGKRIQISPTKPFIFRGGALTDHPHIFDTARYIFDTDFDEIYAEVAPNMRDTFELEDMVYVIGTLKNGVIFSIDPSYANREPDLSIKRKMFNSYYPRAVQVNMQVNGSKGSILVDAYGANYVEDLTPDTFRYTVLGYSNVLDDQRKIFLNEFANNIRKGIRSVDVTLEDHKKTIMAMATAYDSIYEGKPIKIKY